MAITPSTPTNTLIATGENSLQLSITGPAGPAGPAGPTGPNTITTSTTTALNGYIYGNGTTVAGATAATSANTVNTLVKRDGSGNVQFTNLMPLPIWIDSEEETFAPYSENRIAVTGTSVPFPTMYYLMYGGSNGWISDYYTRSWASYPNSEAYYVSYRSGEWEIRRSYLDEELDIYVLDYRAVKTTTAESPVGLTGWTVTNGTGQPVVTDLGIVPDPPITKVGQLALYGLDPDVQQSNAWYYADTAFTWRPMAIRENQAFLNAAQSWSLTQTFTGAMAITNATTSTTTGTGALVVSGGVGIGGAVNVGGASSFTSTTRPTSSAIGAIPSAGTSLMTTVDVDAAPFDAFGGIISPKTANFGFTGADSGAAYEQFNTLFQIKCGSTATGYGRATFNRGLRQTPNFSNAGINFSQAASIAIKAVFAIGGITPKVRLIVGGNGAVPASADSTPLNVAGYGFELSLNASNQVTMAAFRHNGTTFLKDTPIVTGLANTNCFQFYSTFVVSNNGAGTITAQYKTGRTINATSTVTGGPITSGVAANSYVDLVSVNGATSPTTFNLSVQDIMIKLS